MLSVPGKAAVSEVDGVVLEYALVACSYMGGDAAAYLAQIDQPLAPCALGEDQPNAYLPEGKSR